MKLIVLLQRHFAAFRLNFIKKADYYATENILFVRHLP